jgi:N-acetyl-gamma-glutamyl-phosphate reductase
VSEHRILVAGASGYAGALAAHLVDRHPRLELAAATARADVGERLDRLYPRYRTAIELTELDLDRLDGVDAAIVAYPHGAAAPVVAALLERGIRVVDLSADFRLDAETYADWYGEHGRPELLDEAVYGLTELEREAISDARVVANPGCYPTAALLALAPLAASGLIDAAVIDAKSGVSGAGRGGGDGTSFVNVTENVSPYGVQGHRHLPEIRRHLGVQAPVTFVPHLLPVDQGLLASCYVDLSEERAADALRAVYDEHYGGEAFVAVVDSPPGVRDVRDTNLCLIHVASLAPRKAAVFAVIDNLWKGASGQAIQNLNLMLGFGEGEGLA